MLLYFCFLQCKNQTNYKIDNKTLIGSFIVMFGFGKKKGNSAEEMQNWYQDRYASVAIQRNFLLLFSVFSSVALLLCLIVVKKLQEGESATPYLVEYDKNTGYMTIVESKSKQEYTAQQAVKESMLMQYISRREGPQLTTIEEDMNYVRVTTAPKMYSEYIANIAAEIKKLKTAGVNPKYNVKIKSLSYIAANRVQMTITKSILVEGNEVSSMDYKIIAGFGFADIEMPIDDMRINPLGFQVSYYRVTPVKTFKTAINIAEEQKTEPNNPQTAAQQ